MVINDGRKHPGVPRRVTHIRPPVILGMETGGSTQREWGGGYNGQLTAEKNDLNGVRGVMIR